jgi:hypothetical protein
MGEDTKTKTPTQKRPEWGWILATMPVNYSKGSYKVFYLLHPNF